MIKEEKGAIDSEVVKSGAERVLPYSGVSEDSSGKGKQVETMFDNIAPAYDLMNTLMTLGMHTRWRNYAIKRALKMLGREPEDILDVASGTGDVAFALRRRLPEVHIAGLDLSEGMLAIARRKLAELPIDQARGMSFIQGDSLNIPLNDNSFDLITVAYGVRNFENTLQGYREMLRVLRPGGVICVVELCQPEAWLPLAGYKIYTRGIIPAAGRIISGDYRAYSYLHESIEAAPQRKAMSDIMLEAGFRNCKWKALFPGVVCIYLGEK